VKGEFVRGGAAKFFMDGVWESYTALNVEPYADDPNAKPDGHLLAGAFHPYGNPVRQNGLADFCPLLRRWCSEANARWVRSSSKVQWEAG
jgi:hypothetical protein